MKLKKLFLRVLGPLFILTLAAAASAQGFGPAACSSDAQCDDGIFCNGLEVCASDGSCQSSSLPICAPGHICDEETNSCRGPMDREQLWSSLWGTPASEQTAIEILDFNPRQSRQGLLEIRGLDGELEVGSGTLMPLHSTPIFFGRKVLEDEGEVVGEVVLHYIAGQLQVPGHQALALDGLLFTAEIGGESATMILVQDWGDTSERIRQRANAFRSASETTKNSGVLEKSTAQKNSQGPLAYIDGVCLGNWPNYPNFTDCGRSYCNCFVRELSGLVFSSTACVGSLAGLVCLREMGFPPSPARFLLCLFASIASPVACEQAIDDFVEHDESLQACKDEGDACFCNSGEYPDLCDNVESRLNVRVKGLRAGERVDINTHCWSPATGHEKRETLSFEGEGRQVVTCLPDYLAAIEVVGDGVVHPSNPDRRGRRCSPDRYFDSVANLRWGDLEFDCSCDDPRDCPSFYAYASVQGLAPGEEVKTGFAAHAPGTGTQFFNVEARFNLNFVSFESASSEEDWIWSGAKIAYFDAASNPNCDVRPTVDLDSPLTPPPGTSLKVADIVCGDPCTAQATGGEGPEKAGSEKAGSEKAQVCSVDFQGQVSGPGARPVDVQVTIGGQNHQVTLSGSEPVTIANAAPGTAFSGARVVNGVQTDSLCILRSQSSGDVPTQTPFLGVRVDCRSLRVGDYPVPFDEIDEDDYPGSEDVRAPGGFLYCPPPEDSVEYGPCPPGTCEAYEDVGQECPDECENANGTEFRCTWRLNSSGLPTTVTSPWVSGSLAGGSVVHGNFEVEDRLVVSAQAGDPDGLQALVTMVDDEVHAVHFAGGHSLTSTGAFEIDVSGLADGQHEVTFYALDNHPVAPTPGVISAPFTINRWSDPCENDETGPGISFTTPAPGTSPSPGQLWISVTQDDPGDVKNVFFFVDGQMRHNDRTAPWGYTWWADAGPHLLKAKAFDHCGNATEIEMAVSIADPCGGVAPVSIDISNFTDGEWLDPELYHVEATVSDPGGVGIDHVEFRVGGFSPFTDDVAPWKSNGYYLLVEGEVEIEARVLDQCGRSASDRLTVTISENASLCSIDLGPPTVEILSPAHGAQIPVGPTTVTTETDDDTVLLGGTLWIDGDSVRTELSPIPNYSFPWQVGIGQHSVQVRATDVCWKTGFSSVIDVTGHDSGAPLGFAQIEAAPWAHVLEGPAYPAAGRPIVGGRLVDFGVLAAGSPQQAQPITFVNDGNGDLEISSAQITGEGFELVPRTWPLIVAPFEEGAIEVRAKTDTVGLALAAIHLESNGGIPSSLSIASRVRPGSAAFVDGFEGGDLSLWTSTSGSPATVLWNAGIVQGHGLRIQLDGAADDHGVVTKDLGTSVDFLKAQFAFDAQGLTIADGEELVLAAARDQGETLAEVVARRLSGTWQARVRAFQDDGTALESAWLDLDPGAVTLALEWQASIAGQDDGFAKVRVIGSGVGWYGHGEGQSEILDLDNDQGRADEFLLGVASGLVTGMSGPLDYDEVSLWF